MLADFEEGIGCIVMLLIPLAILFFVKWLYGDYEKSENKDVEKYQPKSKGFRKPSSWPRVNVPKINLPKFKDSGWVLFYVICGWIGLVAMIVFSVQDDSTFAFMMLGCSLSCFFAAHVLRLQEKVAFHAEQQTDHAERQTIHAERQTELLEKLSSEKSPIIEDKEK